jgi:hypothetical protein
MSSDWSWYSDAVTLFQYAQTLSPPAVDSAGAARVFEQLWARTDAPVERGMVARSWLWGPMLGPVLASSTTTSPSGWRYERLFEKGLMEINQPFDRMDSGWYVTPGRLAAMLIDQRARLAVAGDPDGGGPTYADLAEPAPQLVGNAAVSTRLKPGGTVSTDTSLERYGVFAGSFTAETGRYTADVFDAFLSRTDLVLDAGALAEAPLFQPSLLVVGYPVTDPYWLDVEVNGVHRDVLVQCFERRCLTYTPSNPPGWEVEMTNIGRHYAQWFDLGGHAAVKQRGGNSLRMYFNQAP